MQPVPQLFDPDALGLHRLRAIRTGASQFLQEASADEVSERLHEINRSFQDIAIVGPHPGIWAKKLATTGLSNSLQRPDTEILDLKPASMDLIVHALSLHWANDPVGQLVQCRNALRPDGLFIGALFAGQTLHELRSAFAEAEAQIRGGISPRVSPMADIRDLGALLQRAGLAMPVADIQRYNVTYATPMDLMRDIRAMGETNALKDRSSAGMTRALLGRVCEIYGEHFGTKDGRICATFEVAFLTGWSPDEGQPKPLRPGSAKSRLADALGTKEISTDETADPGGA